MTPEERAVIDAAIRWSKTETVGQSEDAAEAIFHRLLFHGSVQDL